ncbi:MAG: hypothetical protein IH571_04170 [Acholeplasmataceae bacterium]|nr:hypothetical protein [Acholeplasmataceae bacterium]
MTLHQLKDYVKHLKKDENNSHGYRATASFLMLEHVDLMIEEYLKENQKDQGAILLDVFGLLQGLFVGVDALYDLAIGLTEYKYHININTNQALHELKFIRNDIVGHPTHRTYPNGGMGFSMLMTDDMSKKKLSYETYVYQKNELNIRKKDVFFEPLMDAYQIEKTSIIEDIYHYLNHIETKTDIPEKLARLFETVNLNLLQEIKEKFIDVYNLGKKSNHRFIWRAKLLELLIHWEETDKDLNELILYMSKQQASKMYEIALDMEKRKGQELFVRIPTILSTFYKFIRKNEENALMVISNLHDYSHPLFLSDLDALYVMNPNPNAKKLLDFLKKQTNESNVYLIGSVIRAYRPKK